MKKILTFFGAITMLASGTTSVISCNNKTHIDDISKMNFFANSDLNKGMEQTFCEGAQATMVWVNFANPLSTSYSSIMNTVISNVGVGKTDPKFVMITWALTLTDFKINDEAIFDMFQTLNKDDNISFLITSKDKAVLHGEQIITYKVK